MNISEHVCVLLNDKYYHLTKCSNALQMKENSPLQMLYYINDKREQGTIIACENKIRPQITQGNYSPPTLGYVANE